MYKISYRLSCLPVTLIKMISRLNYEDEEMRVRKLSYVSNSNYMADVVFFLADDIIQGEEVPFYLLWEGDNPEEIEIEFEGFKDVIEMHNAVESKTYKEDGRIVISGFHIPGYLGGVLSTSLTDKPFIHASLNARILFKGGKTRLLAERRKLYTTHIELANLPEEIIYNKSGVHPTIGINFSGITTVFLSIVEMEDNKSQIDIPDDLREVMEKFFKTIINGLEKLKSQFPNHRKAIDLMLNIPSEATITEYIEMLEVKIGEALQDRAFLEACAVVFITALSGKASFRDRILRPMIEYFESSAAESVFFMNPLLHIRIPREGCIMAVRIIGENMLDQSCSNPLEIKVKVRATDEVFIPLKDLFTMRRE